MASRLTAEQTQFFNDNGYLLFHQPVFQRMEGDHDQPATMWPAGGSKAEQAVGLREPRV